MKRSTWTGSADATKTVRACDQQMEDIVIQADGEYHGAAGLEPWGGGSIGLLVLRIEIDRAGIITPLNKAGAAFLPAILAERSAVGISQVIEPGIYTMSHV